MVGMGGQSERFGSENAFAPVASPTKSGGGGGGGRSASGDESRGRNRGTHLSPYCLSQTPFVLATYNFEPLLWIFFPLNLSFLDKVGLSLSYVCISHCWLPILFIYLFICFLQFFFFAPLKDA